MGRIERQQISKTQKVTLTSRTDIAGGSTKGQEPRAARVVDLRDSGAAL